MWRIWWAPDNASKWQMVFNSAFKGLMTGPLCPTSNHESPVTLLKFQRAPKPKLLITSGSKTKEPRYACLSEAKASHSHRMWAEVSSLTTHLLHIRLSISPSRWRCLLRGLCPAKKASYNPRLSPVKGQKFSLVTHLAAKVGTSKCGGKQWQTTTKNLPRMQCARATPVTGLGSGSCQPGL